MRWATLLSNDLEPGPRDGWQARCRAFRCRYEENIDHRKEKFRDVSVSPAVELPYF